MTNRRVRPNPLLLAVLIAGITCGVAQAQVAQAPAIPAVNDGPIPEVVVSAQRSAALESKTPVAMSVLSGEQLDSLGIDNPAGIGARLPNVHLDGAADGLKITIRGVTNADTTEKGDPSAAFLLDGVYLARPQIQNPGFYDLDRIEVLRGPQGTLYGRNTTAGVINVITNAPSQRLEGAFSAEAGNYASRKTSAMLNLPVNDALAVRAALAYNKRDSYLTNGQGTPHRLGLDRNERSARISARLGLGRAASLLVRHDRASMRDHNDSTVPDTNFFSGIETGTPTWSGGTTGQRLTNAFVPPNTVPEQGLGKKTTSGTAAEFTWDLGPATLFYLGSQRSYHHDYLANYHYRVTPALAIGVRHAFRGAYDQDSHELRIATSGSRALTAQAGLYYFREESHQLYVFRDLELLGMPPWYVFAHGPTSAISKAVFAQATWRLTERMRVTTGARYTADRKSRIGSTNFQQTSSFNPATDSKLLNAASLGTHKATWRLGAEYDLATSTLVYGTVATGYKAGGFNDGCLAGTRALGVDCPQALAVPATTLFYQPETLRSYEAGIKTRFWRRRASLNLAAFNYDYSNLQLSEVALVHSAPRYVTTNAGVASVNGFELDGAVAPTASGRFTYALAWLDAHYVAYSPDGVHSWAGKRLDRAPRTVVTLGYAHRFALARGQLTAGLVSRASRAYTISVPSQLLQYTVPSRTTTDATLGWQPGAANWSVLAHVKNLENDVAPVAIDSFGMAVPGEPMTFGVRLDYRF